MILQFSARKLYNFIKNNIFSQKAQISKFKICIHNAVNFSPRKPDFFFLVKFVSMEKNCLYKTYKNLKVNI